VAAAALPAGLSPFYPLEYTEDLRLLTPRYGLSALALVLTAAGGAVLLGRGRRWPAAAFLCYLLAVGPVSGLRQAGSIATADRFAYLPSVVLSLTLAAAGLRYLRGRAGLLAGAALAGVLAALSLRQLSIWRDSETLWGRVVALYPGRCATAHNNLGAWYHRRSVATGDRALLARASAQYRAAVAARPDHASSWSNLGLTCAQLGDPVQAEECYLKAVALRPDFSLAHANLAVLLLTLDRVPEAREHWALAVAGGNWIDPRIRKALSEKLGDPGAPPR
jgi:tetratricopeptide (TPR) repeat protein